MILNNLFALLSANTGMSMTSTKGDNYRYIPSDQTTTKATWYNTYNETGYLNGNDFYFGICIGSGTTPPQRTDYKLENAIVSGLNPVGISANATDGKKFISTTLNNAEESSVTINEIGVFWLGARGNSPENTQPNTVRVLVTRTVLQSPLTINPGETKTITVTIDFNKFIDNVDNT